MESPRETADVLLTYFLRTDRAGLYAPAEGLDTRTAKLFGQGELEPFIDALTARERARQLSETDDD